MLTFHFVFDAPPPPPNGSTPVGDIFAWSVWRALQLGLADLVLEETDDGLVIYGLNYGRLDGPKRGTQHKLATFPHLRGDPLKRLPRRGLGLATAGEVKRHVRVWTGPKINTDAARCCTIVRIVPLPPATSRRERWQDKG